MPQLAAALPSLSNGGRTVRVPLRDSIEFADGTTFDASAVKTSLMRHLTKKDSSRAAEMGPIESIETPDSKTVVLQYKTTFASAAVFPGLAIAIICLAFNLFGDALRDAVDPSTRR